MNGDKVLLITYDLHKPSQEYQKLYDALKTASKWWHYLDSTWLIVTTESPESWWNRLRSTLDSDDLLLIVEVKRNYYGWLPQKAWDWINQNVPYY